MSNAGRGKKVETGGFPKKLKEGTGLGVQKDLSHKVSAKQTDTMFQTIAKNPKSVKTILPAVKAATDTSSSSKPVKRKMEESIKYLENHAPYDSTPMSPKSTEATFVAFNTFANKNPSNLRPRPDSENRSIGQYPHFNFSGGDLSPKSENGHTLVKTFDDEYGSFLSKEEKRETHAYVEIKQHAKRQKTTFTTEDQKTYAEEMRKK